MSAALDAAAVAMIYLAWAGAILLLVVAGAAWAFRRDRPSAPYRREEPPPRPPAGRESDDWRWPLRAAPFDPAAYLATRRFARPLPPGEMAGTAARPVVREWDPEAYRGSLAERAVENVYAERGEE